MSLFGHIAESSNITFSKLSFFFILCCISIPYLVATIVSSTIHSNAHDKYWGVLLFFIHIQSWATFVNSTSKIYLVIIPSSPLYYYHLSSKYNYLFTQQLTSLSISTFAPFQLIFHILANLLILSNYREIHAFYPRLVGSEKYGPGLLFPTNFMSFLPLAHAEPHCIFLMLNIFLHAYCPFV